RFGRCICGTTSSLNRVSRGHNQRDWPNAVAVLRRSDGRARTATSTNTTKAPTATRRIVIAGAAVYAIMARMLKTLVALFLSTVAVSARPPPPAPPDVKPGSINCEECPYPYPTSYLPLTLYGQDVRMAYMDVAPSGAPNGHTVVLLHGNNF